MWTKPKLQSIRRARLFQGAVDFVLEAEIRVDGFNV